MRHVEFKNRQLAMKKGHNNTSSRAIPAPRGIFSKLLSLVYVGGAYSLILAALFQAAVIFSWIKQG